MISEVRFASSKAQAAADLGMSVTTLEKWLRRGAPRLDKGYDVDALAEFIAAWKQRSADGDGEPGENIDELRLRLKIAEALNKEEEAESRRLKNALLRGELLDRDETIADHSERLAMARTVLDTIPDSVAKELSDEDRVRIRGVAKNIVDRALRIIATWRPPQGGQDGSP